MMTYYESQMLEIAKKRNEILEEKLQLICELLESIDETIGLI